MEYYMSHIKWNHDSFLRKGQYESALKKPRQFLKSMDCDKVVLILSYRKNPLKLTISAVCPVARVYSEVLGGPPGTNLRILLDESGVLHELSYDRSDDMPLQPVPSIEWWVRKCALPVVLRGGEASQTCVAQSTIVNQIYWLMQPASQRVCALPDSALLTLERMEAGGHAVSALHVAPQLLTELYDLNVHDCNRAALPFISTLPNLRVLKMDSSNRLQFSSRTQDVGQPLTVVRGLEELDIATFQSASTLTELRVSGNSLRALAGFQSCTALTSLNVSHCGSLTSLAFLAGAPLLRIVDASYSGINNLTGLNNCPNLESLRVDHCSALQNVSALAGAPVLKLLDAAYSGVSNVADLGACPQLEILDVRDCSALSDLTPLLRARRLREIRIGNLDHQMLNCPPQLLPKLIPPVKLLNARGFD